MVKGGDGCDLREAFKQDGDKKKRKPSPYALFVKKQFPLLKKQHPDWKATQIIKEIGNMWRSR